jgi:alpha-L-rhamnosidase
MKKTLILAFLLLSLSSLAQLKVENMRCNLQANPIGIDEEQPQLSWELSSQQRAQVQTAYQLLVATSHDFPYNKESVVFNSGKVFSNRTSGISFEKPLISNQYYYWKVKVWGKNGEEYPWSDAAKFSTGLIEKLDWKAKWIGLEKVGKGDTTNERTRLPARMLRTSFDCNKTVKQAMAYVSGVGLYEFSFNGSKVGDAQLAPLVSVYNKKVFYNTYDITGQVKKGENAVGVLLGNGRYFAPRKTYPYKTKNFGFPRLLFQLNITFEDGSTQIVTSDSTWKVTDAGPILSNNEFDGEEYDATKEIPGWNKPGFIAQNWQKAALVKAPADRIVAQPSPSMKIVDSIRAKVITILKGKPNTYIADYGQNFAGWVRLKIKGQIGDTIKMRFAESLQPDGNLFVSNLRSALQTDVYVLKGTGTEEWQPRFTYHGFRYMEISGLKEMPSPENIKGMVVSDAMRVVGKIETSNPLLNRIFKNMYWGILSNYKGVPTDCPQRDERLGWLGDRGQESAGEALLFDNGAFYKKWLDDMVD